MRQYRQSSSQLLDQVRSHYYCKPSKAHLDDLLCLFVLEFHRAVKSVFFIQEHQADGFLSVLSFVLFDK